MNCCNIFLVVVIAAVVVVVVFPPEPTKKQTKTKKNIFIFSNVFQTASINITNLSAPTKINN